MAYTLPEIEPIQKVKVGRTYKYQPTEAQIAFIKEYASKVKQEELAQHMGVSPRTMKTILKGLQLTNNTKVERERKERQHKEYEAKATARKIIEAEEKGQDPTLFITSMQTGKDLNGVPLSNEHRLAIDELKMASENPKANADMFARMQSAKIQQRRAERAEANRRKNITFKRKQKVQRYASQIRKHYQDMGKWYDVLWTAAKHVANCMVRDEEAQEALDIEGAMVEVVSATGVISYEDSQAAKRADKTALALERAISKLGTEVDKLNRMSGDDDEGPTEADKFGAEIMKMLQQDN